MDRIDKEADETWFKQYKKEFPHLNIGTKKDVIRWCYKKHLEDQIECRKQIKELRNKLGGKNE